VTTPNPPSRGVFGDNLARLSEDLREITGVLVRNHDAVRTLEDHELLALDELTEGGNAIVHAECIRRAEQGRRFSAYLVQDDLAAIAGFARRLIDRSAS